MVGEDCGARHGSVGAWWNRRPDVLTAFHKNGETVDIGSIEHQVVAKWNLLAQQRDFSANSFAAGGELAPFVKFPVVGQVGLGGQDAFLAYVNHDFAVEQTSLVPQPAAPQTHGCERDALPHHLFKCTQRSIEDARPLGEDLFAVARYP